MDPETPIDEHPPIPPGGWHRGHPEARIGGVCSMLARQFDVPLPVVRAGFVLAAVVPGLQGVGLTLYLAIWALTPPAEGEASALDRVVDGVSGLLAGRRTRDTQRPWHDSDPG